MQARSIESEFRLRCQADSSLGLLLAQWEYDRVLIGQALTTVGHLFPHYSLHDSSHSEKILLRIASVLGPDSVARLGATDLWLLLEAAYLHDVGMVTIFSEKDRHLRSPEFQAHVERLTESDDRALASAAKRLQRLERPSAPIDILASSQDLLIVYAEFVRVRHPIRAHEIALNPSILAGIASPRVPILPRRFWNLIGKVCEAHGAGHEFVMALPLMSSGISTDTCHPRLVASLLRLGDLLDLDSDRFCPVLTRGLAQIPETSVAHEGKHAGIRHLLVNNQRIEACGVYPDVEAYFAADSWFTTLREELNYQLVHWHEIAPLGIGPLPSPGTIEAKLEGQILLEPGARPRVEVDRQKLLAIVRGANIYKFPADPVRELLQNAIDATLLRYSYDAQIAGHIRPQDPEDLRAKLQAYPIHVTLARLSPDASNPNTDVAWQLSISDSGIGMRLEDVKRLLTVGASTSNPYRKRLKEWLPLWARPSGAFGMGFQSTFERNNRVVIDTRHPEAAEGLTIEFDIIKGREDPRVVIRARTRGDALLPVPSGTTVKTWIEVKAIPDRFSWSFTGVVSEAVSNFDFIIDTELAVDAAKVFDQVEDMARVSLCSIIRSAPWRTATSDATPTGPTYFDERGAVELEFIGADLWHPPGSAARYRGVRVEKSIDVPILSLNANLMAPDAPSVVEVSRNKLTDGGEKILYGAVSEALEHAIPNWLENGPTLSPKSRRLLMLYAHLYLKSDVSNSWTNWRDEELLAEENSVLTLGKVVDARTVIVRFVARDAKNWMKIRPMFREEEDQTIALANFDASMGPEPLFDLLRKHFESVFHDQEDGGVWVQRYTKAPASTEDFSDSVLCRFLQGRARVGRRGFVPCQAAFRQLQVPENRGFWGGPPDRFIRTWMPNPFVASATLDDPPRVTLPDVTTYVAWVSENYGRDRRRIADATRSFVQHADKLMQAQGWTFVPNKYDIDTALVTLNNLANSK